MERRGSPPARPFFGRSELISEVEHLLDGTRSGTGSGVFLSGSGGVGKSATLWTIALRADSLGFRVVRGRALPEELPAPFSLVHDLLRGAQAEADSYASTELVPGAAIPIFLQPSRSGTPEPVSTPGSGEGLEGLLVPLGLSSVEGLGAMRNQAQGRLVDYFLGLAHDRPLALVIDDLQFADDASIEFVERLARELPGARIAFLATVDQGGASPPGTRKPIERIRAMPAFHSLAVRPLTVPEMTEFVTWLLGGEVPSSEDLLRWHAETEGNPLFVEQLVRSVRGAGGSASPDTGGAADVSEVLLARLRSLADVERRVLTYAAILGREFDFVRLTAAVGLAEEPLTEALDRLVHEGLLREKGGEVYEFASETVRASVHADLTETRRRILHRKVGLALEAVEGASVFELARQFYLGREDAKSVEYNLKAAEVSARSFAFDAALSHVLRALESERRRPERDHRREVRMLTEAGRLLTETGEFVRSEEVFREAVALARAEPEFGLELGRALLGHAWTRIERSDFPTAEPLAREAAALLERLGTARDLLAAERVLGTLYWRLSDDVLAEKHQRAALAIAEKEGTPLEQGHALVDLANAVLPRGADYFDTTLDLYRRAAEIFASIDNPSAIARVQMNRAVLEHRAGRIDDAVRDVRLGLEAAERSRSPVWIGYCLINLSQFVTERGELDLAREAIDRAERILGPTGDRLAEEQVELIRGMIAEADGALDEAAGWFEKALEHARGMKMLAEQAEMLFRLAKLAARRGDRESARARLTEARTNGLLEHRADLTEEIRQLEATLGAERAL